MFCRIFFLKNIEKYFKAAAKCSLKNIFFKEYKNYYKN